MFDGWRLHLWGKSPTLNRRKGLYIMNDRRRKGSGKYAADLKKNKYIYLMILPVLVYLFLFSYKPMYGILIAFKNYRPSLGIWKSEWVGLEYFRQFITDPYFFRVIRNTFVISLLLLVFSFPMPIFFALLLNEVKVKWFKRTIQTVSYMPHFISLVVVCGLISTYCQSNGVINDIIAFFGGERHNLLSQKEYFYSIYVISDIWQTVGWSSIIYLATLSGIDQEQYEAARIDGATRIQQMFYITLPGLLPTISMLLILRMGSILGVGYEKILLLYQPLTYDVADVISTYVYRRGLTDGAFGYSTAVDLFNSVINLLFLLSANKLSKKMGQSGLF